MKHFFRTILLSALAASAAACDEDPTGTSQPAQVAVSGGGGQTAPAGSILAQPVAVTVTDEDGDPVPGVEVRFTVVSGGGSVAPAVDSTDAQGVASAQWRIGTVAADSQVVRVDVLRPGAQTVAATTTVRATAAPTSDRGMTRVSGNGQTGATGTRLADSLVVRVLDHHGNPVPGVPVNWTVQQFGGTVSAPATQTRADGTARVAWTLGPVSGVFVVQATSPGLAPVDFGATATSPGITITVTQPSGSRTWGDSLPVRATAQASTPIVRMTARVEGREANLSAGQGFLNLAGLAEGQKTLLVFAVTSAGDSAATAVPFIYNRAPQLTVVGPGAGSVIRTGAARIDADCTDPSGCTRVAVYSGDAPDNQTHPDRLLAEGTTSFHGDVPLAAFNGQRMVLLVEATDALGGRSVAVLGPLFVESTPTWSEVASGGIRALDTDGTRILYADSAAGGPMRVMVRALSGGTPTELLEVPAGQGLPIEGRLFPGGAIFATRDGVYERRGSATTLLATNPYSAATSLEVEGSWAVWQVGNDVYRRDLAAGTTVFVAAGSTGGSDVASNGDVAHTGAGGFVYRWRDGVSTPVSGGHQGYAPRIDPTQVIFSTPQGSIYLWRGGTPLLLATLSPPQQPPHFYEVNGGWAAFVKADAGGIGHVFSVAPDGTQRQVSSGAASRIVTVGPAGEVVFARRAGNVWRRYLALPPYTAQPLDVGGELGEMRFEGTELYAVVGRSVFRVNY
jgi:hypothetical protein